MPSLLQNAYGEAWGSGGTRSRQLGSSLGTTVPEVNEYAQQQQQQQEPVVETQTSSSVLIPVVRSERGYRAHGGGGDYVFNLSIRIDQQDCHLLCLFIGVFIFSILFTKNKKLSPASLL